MPKHLCKYTPAILAGTAVLCFALSGCDDKKKAAEAAAAAKQQPPATVVVTRVTRENVPINYEYMAETQAISTVDIVPQVSGIITEAPFKEGSIVKAGEKLFQIDPLPYKATLLSTQANLAQTSAALKFDIADMARIEAMVKQNTMTQQDLDKSTAQRDIDAGKCLANNAAIYQAQLNLGYTTITAPFEGQIGQIKLNVGNLATANSSKLATLVSQSPIYATFRIPESDYLLYAENQKKIREGKAGATTMTVSMIIGDGTVLPDPAKINMLDNQIDRQTGTLAVRVTYPNTDKILKPNQFCRVRLTISSQEPSLIIPQTAVMELQGSNSVYVVDTDNTNTVQQRTVQMGERLLDGRWVVAKGLEGDETIISEGLLKVRPGSRVTPMTKDAAHKAVGGAVQTAEKEIAEKKAAETQEAKKSKE